MTMTMVEAKPAGVRRPGPVLQFVRNLSAEWTKLSSVRSVLFAMVALVAVVVGFAVLLSAGMVGRWDHTNAAQRANFHPSTFSVSGVFFGQLVIGALGVLVMAGEYGTGTIRATLAGTPQRLVMYLSKIIMFALVAFTVATVSTVTAFLVAQRILAGKGIGVGFFDGADPRIVIGAALFMVAVAMLGLGLAALLRHTAAAISTLFGLMLVLTLLSNFLPGDWRDTIDRWLPLNAGIAVMQTAPDAHQFGPWTGLAVLAGYALIALVAGGVTLVVRDA